MDSDLNYDLLYCSELSFQELVSEVWKQQGVMLYHNLKYRELMAIRLIRKALNSSDLFWVRGKKHDATYRGIPIELKSATVTAKNSRLKNNFQFQFDKIHEQRRLEEIREHMQYLILAGFDGPAPDPEFAIYIQNEELLTDIKYRLLPEEQERIREKKKANPRNRDPGILTSQYMFKSLLSFTGDIHIIDKEAKVITVDEFLSKFNYHDKETNAKAA